MLFATVINYMDRQLLASVASFVKHDFHLDEEGYGTLEAWFGYAYAAALLAAGLLADRWNLRWLYPIALLVWSAAGMATGFAETFLQLLICRAVLGAGEAFNWPVAVGIVRRIIPRSSQGLANGIFNSGMTLGAVLTPMLVIGFVGPNGEGWRHLFVLVGALGTVWVAAWLWATRGTRAEEISPRSQNRDEFAPPIAFRAVFLLRKFWIAAAVGIAINISWHFYRVWLPRHLVVDLRFSDLQLQYVLIGFFLTADVGSIGFGLLAHKLVSPRRSVEKARKQVLVVSGLICLMATPILFGITRTIMVPLYCVVGAGMMGIYAIWYALVQDISARHTSKCLSLIGAAAWFINGQLHPLVGHFADTHSPAMGKFAPMILCAGILPFLAVLFALTWPENSDAQPVPTAGGQDTKGRSSDSPHK